MARRLRGALIVVLLCGLVYRASAAAEAAEDVCNMRGVDFSSLKDDCSMVSSSMRNGGATKTGACCGRVDALMVDVLEGSKFDQMCVGEFFRLLETNGYPILALNYVDVCGGEDWRRALETAAAEPSSLAQGPSRVPAPLPQTSQPVGPKKDPNSPPSSAPPSSAVTLVVPVLTQLAFAMAAIAFFLR